MQTFRSTASKTTFRVNLAAMLFAAAYVFLLGASVAYAQVDNTAIARTYTVTGTQPVSGDLISFDRKTDTLHLTNVPDDETLFGVVVENPTLVLRSQSNGIPLISSGEVSVNVTTRGGPIVAGDLITSSSDLGKGQKAGDTDQFIVGTALGGLATTTNPGDVVQGSVPVLLSIGPRTAAVTGDRASSGSTQTQAQRLGATLSVVFRYVLAAIVAVGSIAIAFRSFGSSIKESIVSIGRNPLAKASIQAMVVLNTFLIVLVSAAGLFVAFAILFLPIL